MGQWENERKSAKTVKFRGGHVMFSGCIKSDVRKKLLKFDGHLKGENYMSLLRLNPAPDYEAGEVFQHDGDFPCHTSRATKCLPVDEVGRLN